MTWTRLLIGSLASAISLIVLSVIRRGRTRPVPMETIARCSRGHLFITPWITGGPVKAVRLGPRRRYQRCPVGDHWAIVHPVIEENLTEEERRSATAAAVT
jgi:hypothetical protein